MLGVGGTLRFIVNEIPRYQKRAGEVYVYSRYK